MLPWAQKVYEARSATYGHEDPASNCLPEGPRAGLAGLEPFRIVHTPLVSFFMYESSPARQINVAVNLVPDTELLEYVCLENEKDRSRLVGRASDDRSASKKVSRDILARYVGV